MSRASLPDNVKALPVEQQRRIQQLGQRVNADLNNPESLKIVMEAAETSSQKGQDFSRDELLRRSGRFMTLGGASNEIIDQVHAEFAANNMLPKVGAVDVRNLAPLSVEEQAQLSRSVDDVSSDATTPRYYINKYADNAMVGAGNLLTKFGQGVENNPVAKYALIGLDVAAGPVAFLVREAIDRSPVGTLIKKVQNAAIDHVATNLGEVGRTNIDAERGGLGAFGLLTVGGATLTSAMRGIGHAISGLAARGNLRRNLGITDSSLQAHHLVPYAIARNSDAIMHAAKNGYDINRIENGIALPKSKELAEKLGVPQHSGSHPKYSAKVESMVTQLDADFALGNMTQSQLIARIAEIEASSRALVLKSKGRLD